MAPTLASRSTWLWLSRFWCVSVVELGRDGTVLGPGLDPDPPTVLPAVLQSVMLEPGADGCGDGGIIGDPKSTVTLSRADLRATAEALRRSQCSSTLLGAIVGKVRPRTWVLR